MMSWMRKEIIEWWRALLRAIPGRIGVTARKRWYGFHVAKGARILSHVLIYYPENLTIGLNSAITAYCQLNAKAGIEVGENVLIGPGTFIWSQNHKMRDATVNIRDQGYERAPVVIEDDVWIAARCVVLPGVRLAKGTVVAAGAVVTRSTEPYSIVAGVPAKQIGSRVPS
ncbi:putative acetyltransferase [Planctomycetes bacterium CA13]|uniref:Putative acetyltransferase n=1 Tax=Novipirellula herctigrandis TaxID=2527986 RepID=A0A5C5Z2B7_9BACT|nr:putative acetyltransferase [Planctomycetes bacterium CA13]